ncbi:Rad2 family nuclease [Maudiozyma humilis]|uniref:Rad2 family nuclease n=1 Tax=Maudiozyma humilis TaxID=51915 RepID=A0AAV5RQP8_MAUHU|nr:Rad2 family nuclease [Kazachstania humilis]
MGIQGLLPQLKPIQNPVSLRRYEGQTLAIDGYAWLHKAAYSCAYELATGQPTEKYLNFFIKKFSLLKTFGIKPYLVFDGDGVPVKKGTEQKRRDKRKENREIADRLWKSGEKKNAVEFYQKCVDVTPEMAKCVIDYCKTNNIRYIVAPFEADPQMVYLEEKGLVHGIIAEDSDLLVFGCKRLITKLNDFGECIEICRDDFKKLPRKFPLGDLSPEEIRTLVCLSGCDYTDGVPKVGLLTAMKFVLRSRDVRRIILQIQRDGKLKIPKDFIQEYEHACYGFQYQRVFCPLIRKVVTFHPLPEELLSSDEVKNDIASCIGAVINVETREKCVTVNEDDIDHDIHLRQAMGELSPYDYRKPLINREQAVQLKSKSVTNMSNPVTRTTGAPKPKVLTRPVVPMRSIDSFFNQRTSSSRSKVVSHSVSSYNLGSNLIPKYVDKSTETVKRRKLIKDNEDNHPLTRNVVSTSRFFSARCSTSEVQTTSELSSQTAYSRASTVVQQSVTQVTLDHGYPLSDSPVESEVSTEISSSYPMATGNENIDITRSILEAREELAQQSESQVELNKNIRLARTNNDVQRSDTANRKKVAVHCSSIQTEDSPSRISSVVSNKVTHQLHSKDEHNIDGDSCDDSLTDIDEQTWKEQSSSESNLIKRKENGSHNEEVEAPTRPSTRGSSFSLQQFTYSSMTRKEQTREPLASHDINKKTIGNPTRKLISNRQLKTYQSPDRSANSKARPSRRLVSSNHHVSKTHENDVEQKSSAGHNTPTYTLGKVVTQGNARCSETDTDSSDVRKRPTSRSGSLLSQFRYQSR